MKPIPVRAVLPNLVTLLSLCAGLTSIRMSIEMRYEWAIAAVAIAAALDGIDGQVARFLKSASRFGAELDSLADFVNFGVAPGILLYVWALDDAGSIGWIVALIFAICAALRLARFNVAAFGPAKPDWQAYYFVGVPAPAGAMIVFLPVYAEFVGAPHGLHTTPIVLLYTLFVAMLLVSRFPTWSSKLIGRRIRRDLVLPLFVLVVLVVGVPRELPVADDDGAQSRLPRLAAAELARVPQAARRRCGGGKPASRTASRRSRRRRRTAGRSVAVVPDLDHLVGELGVVDASRRSGSPRTPAPLASGS